MNFFVDLLKQFISSYLNATSAPTTTTPPLSSKKPLTYSQIIECANEPAFRSFIGMSGKRF
jgi:hypothetical protein